MPFAHTPPEGVRTATDEQLQNVALELEGYALRWEKLESEVAWGEQESDRVATQLWLDDILVDQPCHGRVCER